MAVAKVFPNAVVLTCLTRLGPGFCAKSNRQRLDIAYAKVQQVSKSPNRKEQVPYSIAKRRDYLRQRVGKYKEVFDAYVLIDGKRAEFHLGSDLNVFPRVLREYCLKRQLRK